MLLLFLCRVTHTYFINLGKVEDGMDLENSRLTIENNQVIGWCFQLTTFIYVWDYLVRETNFNE